VGHIYDVLHFLKQDKWENKNESLFKTDIKYWLHFLKRTPEKRKANEFLANNNLKMNLAKQIKQLKKPLFLISATHDQFIRKNIHKDFERLGVKKFKYKIIKGTHSLPQSQPKKIAKVILDYLKKEF